MTLLPYCHWLSLQKHQHVYRINHDHDLHTERLTALSTASCHCTHLVKAHELVHVSTTINVCNFIHLWKKLGVSVSLYSGCQTRKLVDLLAWSSRRDVTLFYTAQASVLAHHLIFNGTQLLTVRIVCLTHTHSTLCLCTSCLMFFPTFSFCFLIIPPPPKKKKKNLNFYQFFFSVMHDGRWEGYICNAFLSMFVLCTVMYYSF